MHYHIGNVFCVVVRNVHGWIFQVQNHIRKIQMLKPTITFHAYQRIECCTIHGRRPFNEKKQCKFFETPIYSIVTEKCIP